MHGTRQRRGAVRRAALIAAVIASAAVGWSLAQQRPQPRGRPARGIREPGRPAPDFELPVLKFEKDKKGELVGRITDEKVKLSDFRGRRSVVVFFSSYT